jgi:hypothetical protein
MNGYTHHRYLIINIKDGSKKTILVKVGTTPKVPAGYKLGSCIGGTNLSKETKSTTGGIE